MEIKMEDGKRKISQKHNNGIGFAIRYVLKAGKWESESFLTTNPMFGLTLVVISSLKTEEICGCS